MSITAVNAVWYGSLGSSTSSTPTVSGEILALSGVSSGGAQYLDGFCVPILDGSSTTFTLNWIDGTATLQLPPCEIQLGRIDPPAWTAATYYPTNAVVLGSGHVQQATTGGKSGASAPSWSTSGGTVTDGTNTVWTDLGAIAASTIYPTTSTAITNIHATITFSAAGTSTQVPVFNFRIRLNP